MNKELNNLLQADISPKLIVISMVVAVIAVLSGYYISISIVPTPKIGIINLTSTVNGLMAETISREIEYARKSSDIKGVVIMINSPGGSAAAGHDIYFQVRKLRDEKPVIASMDVLAASAAYQIAVAANEIYAKPASMVGNIGVILQRPPPAMISERVLTTGPFKSTGGSSASYLKMLDLLHADFRDSVVAERSKAPNPLNITGEQLATGEIWIGVEAKEFGLIDELGSRLDAIDAAAKLANLANYDVVNIKDEYLASLSGNALAASLTLYEDLLIEEKANNKIDISAKSNNYPSFYQLYIPLE